MKHTSGPWAFFPDSMTVGRPMKNSTDFRGDTPLIATICKTRIEAEANGRIIALAPELLACCKLALSSCDPHAATTRYIESIIAKAEGK